MTTTKALILRALEAPAAGALGACFGHGFVARRVAAYERATARCARLAAAAEERGFAPLQAGLLQVVQKGRVPVRANAEAFAALAEEGDEWAATAAAWPQRNPLAFYAALGAVAGGKGAGLGGLASAAFVAGFAAALAADDAVAIAVAGDGEAARVYQIALAWRTERRAAAVVEAARIVGGRDGAVWKKWLYVHHVAALAGCLRVPEDEDFGVTPEDREVFRQVGMLLVHGVENDVGRALVAPAFAGAAFAARHTGGLRAVFEALAPHAAAVDVVLSGP